MASFRWPRSTSALAVVSVALAAACGGPEEESAAAEPAPDQAIGIDNALGHFNGDFEGAGEVGEGDVASPDPVAPEIFDAVKVFDPRLAQFFGIGPQRLVIPVRGNEELSSVGRGHVLVSESLFMRKVVEAARVGDDWVFDTVDAQLTDAVKQGDFALRVVGYRDTETGKLVFYDPADDIFSPTYDPAWGAARNDVFGQGGLGALRQGVEGVEQSVSASGKLGDGRYGSLGYSGKLQWKPNMEVGFVPGVVLTGSVRCCEWTDTLIPTPYPYVQSFEMSASGTFNLTLGAEFKAQGAVSGSLDWTFVNYPLGIKPDKPAPLVTVPCAYAAGAIGVVPIWSDFCPSVTATAEATVAGTLTVNAQVAFSKTVGGGFRYNRDAYPEWTKWVNNPPLSVTPTVTTTAAASIKGGIALKPKLEFKIYSVAGPFVSFSTGLELESKCTAPELKNSLSWVNGLSGGVALSPPGWVQSIAPSVSKLSYSAKLWSPAPVKIWQSTDQCDPAQLYLTYQSVRAAPQNALNLQTLDLDLNLDVPGPNGPVTMSRDNQLPNRVAPDAGAFPFADYMGMQCSGCAESVLLRRTLTPGTYKVWVSDYDNDQAVEANDAMSRARAQVRIVNGAQSLGPYNAPGGSYNRWDVASFTSNAAGRLSVSTLNQTSTSNLH